MSAGFVIVTYYSSVYLRRVFRIIFVLKCVCIMCSHCLAGIDGEDYEDDSIDRTAEFENEVH